MRKWLPLTAVCLGTFMLLIDVTIVNVALPDMAVDLSASFSSLQWVIDAYALVLAALLLGIGSLSDIIGRRLVYLAGLGLFALSSLACGLAPNAGLLVAARAVQGVGAAAMFATTIALLNAAYSGRERGIAYGIWGAVSGAAAAIGPTVGGLLTEHLSWRWIFFVNLPISAVAIVLSIAVLDGAAGTHRGRFDVGGLVAFTAAAGLVTYGFIRAGEYSWTDTTTVLLLVGGGAAALFFVIFELRVTNPLLDIRLFSDRRFTAVVLTALMLSAGAFAYLAYSSIWMQSVLGLSPVAAGAVYLPLSVSAFIVSAVIGRHLNSTDPRWLISVGLFLIGAGGLAQATLDAGSSWPALVIGLFLVGVGVGLVNPTMAASIMSAVPVHRGGMAAGAMNTARQLGLALGIAVLGTVLQSRIAGSLSDAGVPSADGLAKSVSGGQTGAVLDAAPAGQRAGLDHAIHAAFASGLNTIFVIAGAATVVTSLTVAYLLRPVAELTAEPATAVAAG